MFRVDKSKYSAKQKREAKHIEEASEKREFQNASLKGGRGQL